jgi:glycosyltransferase involved in cell wall biosynthesis
MSSPVPKSRPMPFFSVIIPTRNRPTEFRQALGSVLNQSWTDTEIIVVNDGSGIEHQDEYQRILDPMEPERVRAFTLVSRPKGHGGSYVRNFGAAKAKAPYLCFLDDDDCWTDRGHLNRAQAVIHDATAPVDLYMSNQAAFLNGGQQPGPIWIEDLPGILAKAGNSPDRHGTYTVTIDELLQSRGFCHLNTLIVRRGLFEDVGGMEESIRWEEDRDLYLRLIDSATITKYAPVTVARHNVPDPAKAASMTTALSHLERRLFQLTVFDRALHLTQHPRIRSYARRQKGYALKRIAESLASNGRYYDALIYARDALRLSPTFKWSAYTAWLALRATSRAIR